MSWKEQADNHFRQGNYQAALFLYRKCLEEDQHTAVDRRGHIQQRILSNMVAVHLHLGQHKEALIRLAEVHRAMGNETLAMDVLTEQVLEREPDNEVAEKMLQDILTKKFDEVCMKVKEKADKLFCVGNYAEAILVYRQALAQKILTDRHFKQRILFNMVMAHLRLKNTMEALTDAERCIACDPTWTEAYIRLALVHRAMGNETHAMDILTDQVLKREPDNHAAEKMLDDILTKKRIEMRASPAYTTNNQYDTKDLAPATPKDKADSLFLQSKYPEALLVYQQALQAITQDSASAVAPHKQHLKQRILCNMALVHLHLDQHKQALVEVNRCIACDPTWTKAYIRLAEVHRAMGQTTLAMDILNDQVLECEPDNEVAEKMLDDLLHQEHIRIGGSSFTAAEKMLDDLLHQEHIRIGGSSFTAAVQETTSSSISGCMAWLVPAVATLFLSADEKTQYTIGRTLSWWIGSLILFVFSVDWTGQYLAVYVLLLAVAMANAIRHGVKHASG